MEAAAKHLRDGRLKDESSCPLAIVFSSLETIGGQTALCQVLEVYVSALAQGRAQAQGLTVVAVDCSPSSLTSLCGGCRCHVIDLHEDPYGWNRAASAAPPSLPAAQSSDIAHIDSHQAPAGLQELHRQILSSISPTQGPDPTDASLSLDPASSSTSPPDVSSKAQQHPHGSSSGITTQSFCLVIDSLSTLLLRYPGTQVLQLLDRLRQDPHVSCIMAGVREDLHPPGVLHGLHSLSSCMLQLSPLRGLAPQLIARQLSRPLPHGRLDIKCKRRAGRVAVDPLYYTVTASGHLDLFAGPGDLDLTPQALLPPVPAAATAAVAGSSTSAAAAGGGQSAGTVSEVSRLMAGGMRLELSEKERAAKAAVVLPYEHQGQAAVYSTGDFKDYLPVAAGGRGGGGEAEAAGQGKARLGHILYVRDSDGEHDSDEDPDDDLDI